MNKLIIISGPSGVGKGTIAKLLIERNSSKMALSVSCTTRLPRNGEVHGREYFFISKEEFQAKIDKDDFLEYSGHFENYYGTPKGYVKDKLTQKDVILEIDVNGGLAVKEKMPEALLIMVLPPSIEELKNRLIKRNTETLEKILKRMERIEFEISQKNKYDYVVVNDDLLTAVEEIENIIKKEKN